jgi:hypothetical protein
MKPFLIRLSKVLLRFALDEGLKRALPRVYKQLDAEVPVLMFNNAAPSQVQGAIASAISNATGRRASASQIEAVIGLYDPVKAALNRLR